MRDTLGIYDLLIIHHQSDTGSVMSYRYRRRVRLKHLLVLPLALLMLLCIPIVRILGKYAPILELHY